MDPLALFILLLLAWLFISATRRWHCPPDDHERSCSRGCKDRRRCGGCGWPD